MYVSFFQYFAVPLVLGPELAIESRPGPVCLRERSSSSNLITTATVFDWKAPVYDWEAPVFDWKAPVFDREVRAS